VVDPRTHADDVQTPLPHPRRPLRACRRELCPASALWNQERRDVVVDVVRAVRRSDGPSPRGPRVARHRRRRSGGDDRQQPPRVGGHRVCHLRTARGLRAHVRIAAQEGVGLHPRGLRRQGGLRRERQDQGRHPRREERPEEPPPRDRARRNLERRRHHLEGAPRARPEDPRRDRAPRAERRRGAHLHLGHDGQAQGREALALQHRQQRERDARGARHGAGDRSLSFLPWAHSFGQVVELHGLFSMGASLGIAESVDKILANLGGAPTLVFSVPRVFNRLYDRIQQEDEAMPAMAQRARGGDGERAERSALRRTASARAASPSSSSKLFDKLVSPEVAAPSSAAT
jgi:hypothetical protein